MRFIVGLSLVASLVVASPAAQPVFRGVELGVMPTDTARVEASQVPSYLPRSTNTSLYRWWAKDGDTAAIHAYVNFFTALNPRTHDPSAQAMNRANIAAGNAYLALAKHDTASAVQQMLSAADTLHNCWYQTRTSLVRLLIATKRYSEAIGRLERRWPGTSECGDGVEDVEWTLERARIFDRFGWNDRAIKDYQFVAAVWRTADPELQPLVREARDAVARLRGIRAVTKTSNTVASIR